MTPGGTSTSTLISRISPRWLRNALPALIGLALAAWAASGFYTVASNERGVVLRFGRCRGVSRPGIHYALPWPIDRVYTPETTEVKRIEVGFKTLGRLLTSAPRRSDALTGDQNILRVMMTVQYKIKDPVSYLFGAEEPDWLVERAVEAAMKGQIAALAVDEVLTTAMAEIQIGAVETAQRWLDRYGAGIVLLWGSLQTVSPPVPVLEAFKEVTDAKKDSERQVFEARAYTNRIIPQAGGEAQRIISRAEGYYAVRVNRARGEASRFTSLLAEYREAKDVTRTRLFLDTMQEFFAPARVIVLDPDQAERPTRITIVDK